MKRNKFCCGIAAVLIGLFELLEPFLLFKFKVFMRTQGRIHAPQNSWVKERFTDPLHQVNKRERYGNEFS